MERRYRRRLLAALLAALLPATAVLLAPIRAAAATVTPAELRARAIYFHRTGDADQRALAVSSMATASEFSREVWSEFLAGWEAADKGVKVYTSMPKGLPAKGHVFVVLGSALSKTGKMTTKLERRLKLALVAAENYPNSQVLVSGGVERGGRTEAAAMRSWLLAKGVAEDRILTEARSSSTIGNATNSMAILAKEPGVTSYTLISDASHIRRSTILFNAAKVRLQEQTGKPLKISAKANYAYSDSSTASRGPVPPATADIIASNVASVFGVLSSYRALTANPPAAPRLSSIRLTPPTTRTYQVGQAFDPAGLAVTALFDGGALSRTVTEPAAISGFDSSQVGKTKVTVAYTHGSTTKTASFTCTIVKADSEVRVNLSTTKVRKGRTRLVVTAAPAAVASPVAVDGEVRFYLNGKLQASVVTGPGKPAVTRLARINKAGKYQLKVRYLGSGTVTAAEQTVTIKVVS